MRPGTASLSNRAGIAIYPAMKAMVFSLAKALPQGRHLRGTFDFASIGDRDRMPWRFLARRMAVDGLCAA